MIWRGSRYSFLCSWFLCGILLLRGTCHGQLVKTKADFRKMVDKNEIRENLRRFAARPHATASKGEELITNYIRDTWKHYGFEVEEPEYDVLLPVSPDDKPNKVSIINNITKEVEWESVLQINVTAGEGQDGTVYTYTPQGGGESGVVEGELVYVGEGWWSIEELKKRGISLKGKIVLVFHVQSAAIPALKEGAVAEIRFPDPYFFAKEGTGVNDTYPNTPFMPGDALFSGLGDAAFIGKFGDRTTPVLPSTCGMGGRDVKKIGRYPVPSQAISYDDGRHLLSRMKGEKAPDSMTGSLNVDYRLGPGMKPTRKNPAPVVRLEVNNHYVTKKIRNVIATIPGSVEPDRYVLIGNHKDAIVFGGSDASSGTAVLMEISRVLWKLKQKGWKPRRTIKLCSWTGEEEGLIGSSEWVQENLKLLKKRAVAYLNTDPTAMGRNLLNVQATPMLGDVILNNAKELKDPANSSLTLFDSMVKILPKSNEYPGEPHIYSMEFYTDHLPFLHQLGLSVADLNYFLTHNDERILYPLYHTQYDTFEWVARLADPGFIYSRLMARLIGGILLDLSDSEILPLNVTRFAKTVQKAFQTLQKSDHSKHLDELQSSYLKKAIKKFVNVTNEFESTKTGLNIQQRENPLILRMLNDQMTGLGKTFVSPHAIIGFLVGQNDSRIVREVLKSYKLDQDHLLIKNEKFNNFDRIARMENLREIEKDEYFKFEMSLIIQAVRDATKLLTPLT